MFVEYIKPDKRIREDFIKIKDCGMNNPKPEEAIAERGRNLRAFVSKWENYVSSNFIRIIKEIIELTKPDVNSKPKLPDIGAYNLEDEKQLTEFWQEVVKAWNELEQFYQSNLHKRQVAENKRPIDKFFMITDKIDQLLLSVKDISHKVVEFNHKTYTFMPIPESRDRIFCQLEDEDLKGYEHFSKLAENSREAVANLPRWALYETKEDIKNSTVKTINLKSQDKSITELVDDEDQIKRKLNDNEVLYSVNKVVPAKTLYGKKVPAPDKDSGLYSRTYLTSMRSEYLTIIAASMGVDNANRLKRKELIEEIDQRQLQEVA